MKLFRLLPMIFGALVCGLANGADITMYYSPTCPHCHHAHEFLNTQLIAEYPNVTIEEVNVMTDENLSRFRDVLKKCKYNSGGVPVIVIGEKCFQGYADFMQPQIRDAVKIILPTDDANSVNSDAAANNVAAQSDLNAPAPRTTSGIAGIRLLYGLLVLLAVVLAFTVFGRPRKK